MFKRTLLALTAFAVAASVHAAPKWVELPHSLADTSFLNHSSIDIEGQYVDVDILRNYDETIDLGTDPISGELMYVHRSVEITYAVDCDSRKVALTAWKLFDGNFGSGEVVWADSNWGNPAFTNASDDETRAAMISACATKLASQ